MKINGLNEKKMFPVEENEILELEKQYWTLKSFSAVGPLDLQTLLPLLVPPLSEKVATALFSAFDENRSVPMCK